VVEPVHGPPDGVRPNVPGTEAVPGRQEGLALESQADTPAGPVALFFAAKGGGVQRVSVTIANALAARGLEVTCVLPEATGPFLERLAPAVALVDLKTRRPHTLILRLARYLREARPAALIAAQQHAIVAALLARRMSGVDVTLTAIQHNTLSELCRQSRRPAVRWLLPSAARLLFRRADQVGAVSQGVARDLAAVTGIPLGDIQVVYNPAMTPDIAGHAELASGHAWLDAKDRPVILAVGNLIPIKDFAMLIRAFARVRRDRPCRLVILGEGAERPRLERLAHELGIAADVDLPGFAPNPYAFMARADAFALASRVEGMPVTIIEALACGCPVVATDCPSGPAEILQDGRHGRLVPVGDDDALATAILATLQAPPARAELQRRAADFAVERAVERYIELLKRPRAPAPDSQTSLRAPA
jgi:glycosyltransferase involved in cell wall biosynthesis